MANNYVFNVLQNPVVRPSYVVIMPNFRRTADGSWVDDQVNITTLKEFGEYSKEHDALISFLKTERPDVLVKIYSNALCELTGTENGTIAGRLLSGEVFQTSEVYKRENEDENDSDAGGKLNTFRMEKLRENFGGFAEDEVVVKRPRKQLVGLIKTASEGFYVPQIDKNGLNVAMGAKPGTYDVNFVAIGSLDITEQELQDYFRAPFENKVTTPEQETCIKKLINLCKRAYKNIGTSEMDKDVAEIMKVCSDEYPLAVMVTENKDEKTVASKLSNPLYPQMKKASKNTKKACKNKLVGAEEKAKASETEMQGDAQMMAG